MFAFKSNAFIQKGCRFGVLLIKWARCKCKTQTDIAQITAFSSYGPGSCQARCVYRVFYQLPEALTRKLHVCVKFPECLICTMESIFLEVSKSANHYEKKKKFERIMLRREASLRPLSTQFRYRQCPEKLAAQRSWARARRQQKLVGTVDGHETSFCGEVEMVHN